MRKSVVIMIAFLMAFSLGACDKIDKTLKVNKEPPTATAGRYTLHIGPHPSNEKLLLDSATGRTWLLTDVKGKNRWEVVPGGPTDKDPLGLFDSDNTSRKFRILSVQEPDGKIIRYDERGNRLPDDPKKMTDNQLLDALGVERR